jgi:hypothetical protein
VPFGNTPNYRPGNRAALERTDTRNRVGTHSRVGSTHTHSRVHTHNVTPAHLRQAAK